MSAIVYDTFRDFADRHPLYMVNRYGGKCWRCGEYVPKGKGCVVKRGKGRNKTHHIAHLPVAGECNRKETTT